MQQQVDQERTREFAGKLLGIYTGCALTKLIDIGHQTGLFDAGAKRPGTSHDLAERAGLNERYVREWLGAMTTGGFSRTIPSPAGIASHPSTPPCSAATPQGTSPR